MLERMWKKQNPHTLLVGLQIGTATMENGMEVPQKTNNYLPNDPAILLLDIYPQTLENPYPKMFIEALVIGGRTWKQPKCPMTDDWLKKL